MDFDMVYFVIMIVVGVLAILANVLMLVIVWKGTTKGTKNVAVMIVHLVFLQIGATLLIMFMQPRMFSNKFMKLHILQGPISYLNTPLLHKTLFDLYLAFLHAQIYAGTFMMLYNSVLVRFVIKTTLEAFIFVAFITFGSFIALFVIYNQCYVLNLFMVQEEFIYHLDYENIFGKVCYGVTNCRITYWTSYIALGMLVLWIPELLLLLKFHPVVKDSSKLFVTKQEKAHAKPRLVGISIMTLTRMACFIPSIYFYVFYNTLDYPDNVPLLWMDLIVFFLPLLSSLLTPLMTIYSINSYKECFLYSICRIKRRNVVINVRKTEEISKFRSSFG